MIMLCMTHFWKRGKRSLIRCKPNKRDENGNGLGDLLLDSAGVNYVNLQS